jgi:hypothetical protein
VLERLRAFISYAFEDGSWATVIRSAFERWGCETFIAHDDMPGGADIEERVLREIKRAHVFLPIITPRFRLSPWTDQEVGIAVGVDCPLILPMCPEEIAPHGFLRSINAPRFGTDIERVANDIFDCIKARGGIPGERLVDSLVAEIRAARSFSRADMLAAKIAEMGELTGIQAEAIVEAAYLNDQIYGVVSSGTAWRSDAAWQLADRAFLSYEAQIVTDVARRYRMAKAWVEDCSACGYGPEEWLPE